jgi:glycosyltransferase involved in cell wall biosynthesis
MFLAKPTIVNDTLGVRDHIRHMETGLIVDGSAGSYVEALNWVFNPNNREAVKCMNAAAQNDVLERFSFDRHIECVLEILDQEIQ